MAALYDGLLAWLTSRSRGADLDASDGAAGRLAPRPSRYAGTRARRVLAADPPRAHHEAAHAHLRVPLQGLRRRARSGPVVHRRRRSTDVPQLRRRAAQGVRRRRHHLQGHRASTRPTAGLVERRPPASTARLDDSSSSATELERRRLVELRRDVGSTADSDDSSVVERLVDGSSSVELVEAARRARRQRRVGLEAADPGLSVASDATTRRHRRVRRLGALLVPRRRHRGRGRHALRAAVGAGRTSARSATGGSRSCPATAPTTPSRRTASTTGPTSGPCASSA